MNVLKAFFIPVYLLFIFLTVKDLMWLIMWICYVNHEVQRAIQCRHIIPALNAWADRAYYTTACPIATQLPWHGCMDYITTEHSFDSQAT